MAGADRPRLAIAAFRAGQAAIARARVQGVRASPHDRPAETPRVDPPGHTRAAPPTQVRPAPRVPVIACTAVADERAIHRAKALGCDRVLRKPCLPEEVERAIDALFARKEAATA